MAELELLSPVALLEDLPDSGLVRGQMGTVVLVHSPMVVEVEFCDPDGRTYAMLALDSSVLLLLHPHPVKKLA